jgi:hypothetical protein
MFSAWALARGAAAVALFTVVVALNCREAAAKRLEALSWGSQLFWRILWRCAHHVRAGRPSVDSMHAKKNVVENMPLLGRIHVISPDDAEHCCSKDHRSQTARMCWPITKRVSWPAETPDKMLL